MRRIKTSILVATALIISSSLIEADAQERSLKECAFHDAQFMLQLDQHRERADVAGDRLHSAFLTMLRARCACSGGRTNEAIALYDSVFGPVLARAKSM